MEKAFSGKGEAAGHDGLKQKRILIQADGLGKMFRLSDEPKRRLWRALVDSITLRPKRGSAASGEKFWALKDVTFSVAQGEVLGVIGKNGSGKTTLLQLIAGISEPSEGFVRSFGKISTLLELGSGFHRDFTGRENIYISGMISGFSRKEIDLRVNDIISFADISRFVDQPVRTYSNGMFVRLSFAVQTYFDPEILLIDEVLSVGDVFFQQKCHERIASLIKNGAATVIVSHDHYVIQKYCTKVLVLDGGRCVFTGGPNEALQKYFLISNNDFEKETRLVVNESLENVVDGDDKIISEWPSKDKFLDLAHAEIAGKKDKIKFSGAAVCDGKGEGRLEYEIGETAYFYYEFEVVDDIDIPISGLSLVNSMNVMVHAKTSIQNGVRAPCRIKKGARLRFSQAIRLSLQPGNYTLMIGIISLSPSEYAFAISQSLFDFGLHNRLLLMITNVGPLRVKPAASGLDLPFYGYADLEGYGALSVVYDRDAE